ncbi:hypothetical protein GCM10009798_43600 [Nocardioides panacihumi]|uniref:SnoaL-like domain-containing protein n=1 Tax=Nocardioides panacihumi TaxID=400774 RepID=A0ABP5DD84_9ACTN
MTSPEANVAAPRLLVPILVVGLLVGVFVVVAWPSTPPGAPAAHRGPPPVAGVSARIEAQAAGVLRDWDRRRAAAWSSGDARALEALYVPGASAAEADVAMLTAWTARGLAVDDLTTQLLAVHVRARGPTRWVLRVRDRVTGAVAAGAGRTEQLPAGTTSERDVALRLVRGAWLVASVRPVPRTAPGRR